MSSSSRRRIKKGSLLPAALSILLLFRLPARLKNTTITHQKFCAQEATKLNLNVSQKFAACCLPPAAWHGVLMVFAAKQTTLWPVCQSVPACHPVCLLLTEESLPDCCLDELVKHEKSLSLPLSLLCTKRKM